MNVHVPESRNQVPVCAFEYLRSLRWLQVLAVSHRRNAVTRNDDRAVAIFLAALRIDHCDMRYVDRSTNNLSLAKLGSVVTAWFVVFEELHMSFRSHTHFSSLCHIPVFYKCFFDLPFKEYQLGESFVSAVVRIRSFVGVFASNLLLGLLQLSLPILVDKS